MTATTALALVAVLLSLTALVLALTAAVPSGKLYWELRRERIARERLERERWR